MATSVRWTFHLCTLSLIVLCQILPSHQQDDPILMTPASTVAARGTDAVFYCKIRSGTKDLVYWVVNRQIGLGPYMNNNRAYPRYEIFGDGSRGYYNLRIKNVTASDAVRYDCIVERVMGTSNYEAGAVLTVVDDAVAPTTTDSELCISGPQSEMTYEEGDELPNYTCQATGGTPVGELRWNSLRSDRSLADVGYDIIFDGSTITAVSSSYILTAEDHESQMACSLSHPSLNADRACYYPTTGKILVRHAPQVRFGPAIEITYLESTSFLITCTASAYPDVSPFGPVLTFSDPDMVFNITRKEAGTLVEATVEVSQSAQSSDVGKHINCTAANAVGETIATIKIRLKPVLPSWLLITLLLIGVVILLVITICCCVCCCKPDRKGEDQTDRANGEAKAAGYDVNTSRASSMYKPNGIGDDHNHIMDDDSFDIPLNDYSAFPPPPSPPPAPLSDGDNDHETGEVNEGYLTPTAHERFPPMIEDEHLMGDKSVTSFKPSDLENDVPSPPPPPPLDLEPPGPIPSVDAE